MERVGIGVGEALPLPPPRLRVETRVRVASERRGPRTQPVVWQPDTLTLRRGLIKWQQPPSPPPGSALPPLIAGQPPLQAPPQPFPQSWGLRSSAGFPWFLLSNLGTRSQSPLNLPASALSCCTEVQKHLEGAGGWDGSDGVRGARMCVWWGDSILSNPLLPGRKEYNYILFPFEISSYKFQGLSFDTEVGQVAWSGM